MMDNNSSLSRPKHKLNDDWLAVIIALILIILAALGVLGPGGLNITF